MKKIYTLVLFLGAVSLTMAQTAPRDMVILEIGTGTWCYYCPGAAMGADDLVEGGAHVAVVENHNGDPFANQFSNARNSYYSISGYPTAKVDGILTYVGGSHTQSMGPQYYSMYMQRINVPTALAMSMNITNTGADYSAVLTLTKLSNLPSGSLKLRFCVTVSNVDYNWQGQTHLNFIDAIMVPDATGTTVDFGSGNTQTITLNYSLDPTWPIEDIEFIAFVQNDSGKEILNGIKKAAIDLQVDFTASATQVSKNEPITFTSEVTGGYLHAPNIHHWYFPGGTPDTTSLESPTVTYSECGPHDVTLILDRGGELDTVVKTAYITIGPLVNITAIPNDTICDFEVMTLDATTPDAASYLWQPGGETTPTIEVSYPEYDFGAHTFTAAVTDNDGCTSQKSIAVFIDNCTALEAMEAPFLSIYPNPGSGLFTIKSVNVPEFTGDLAVFNTMGMVVYSRPNAVISVGNGSALDLSHLSKGIYYLSIMNNGRNIVHKLIIE